MDDISKESQEALTMRGEWIWGNNTEAIEWMLQCIVWEKYGGDKASPINTNGASCIGADSVVLESAPVDGTAADPAATGGAAADPAAASPAAPEPSPPPAARRV